MKKALIALIALIVVAGIAALAWPRDSQTNESSPGAETTQTTPVEDRAETPTTYTAADVAKHNNRGDCWTIINNKVYDLTSFISRHEGGDEILRACGIDGSSLFNERQTAGGESVGSGTPHSGSAMAQLAQLQIGVLVN